MQIEMCDNFFYRVSDCDEEILKKFNTSKDNILRNNNEIKQYTGEWLKIKINDYQTHHVKPMETLKNIALSYNIEEEKIIKDNDLSTNKLFIGQCLKIYNKKPTD